MSAMTTIATRALIALLLAVPVANAQDTFSIVAVDTATGEVGSAGASCVAVDVRLISDVHPGVGATHTQAYYRPINQEYARSLMTMGLPPSAIIDSLVAHDEQATPDIRQYGTVVLAGGGASAGWTGSNCNDYKGHRLGATYAIQGNILLGAGILDSMEARFLRTEGTLAERLMAALQGANVPGADTRCSPYGTTSLSAFVRVARPGDRPDSLYLDLHADVFDGSHEPIDTLQELFNAWSGASGVTDGKARVGTIAIMPNPTQTTARLQLDLERPTTVTIALFDELGHSPLPPITANGEPGVMTIDIPLEGLPRGTYYCRVGIDGLVHAVRLMVEAR